MTHTKVFESLSAVIKDTSIDEQIRERFTPIFKSNELIETISSLSDESPVFKSYLSRLSESVDTDTTSDFIEVYNSFYNDLIIISDELSQGIKNNVDKINDIELPISLTEGSKFISSRIFVGNSILLAVTSNEDILAETLKVFYSDESDQIHLNKTITP